MPKLFSTWYQKHMLWLIFIVNLFQTMILINHSTKWSQELDHLKSVLMEFLYSLKCFQKSGQTLKLLLENVEGLTKHAHQEEISLSFKLQENALLLQDRKGKLQTTHSLWHLNK